MPVTILDAIPDPRISQSVRAELDRRGHPSLVHRLGEERFAPCQGCWECWVTHPGTCKAKDAGNSVMRDIIRADEIIWITRPRFGCWDPIAKAALDKTIGLLSPFFKTVDGETHHHRRYHRYPRWNVLALVPPETPEVERDLFERLVARNVLNLQSEAPRVRFLELDPDETSCRNTIRDLFDGPQTEPIDASPPAPFAPRREPVGPSGKRAVLWVGSAKPPGTSTSESYGRALLDALEATGWSTETVHLAKMVKLGKTGAPKLLASIERTDLLVLSAPVYIDCLPALVVSALGHVVDHRPEQLAIVPIVQCGFPELSHTTLALEILERAARTGGLGWSGHLACGEGGAVDGRPIELNSRTHAKAQALLSAAAQLDAGEPISREVSEAFARPILPEGVYRTVGQLGWLASAIREGGALDLFDRPFEQT